MSDDKKGGWSKFVEGDEDDLGMSKDMLRKLMAVNPSLRDNRNTDDVLKSVKEQMKSGKPAPAKAAEKEAPPLDQQLETLSLDFDERMAALVDEEKAIAQRKATLRAEVNKRALGLLQAHKQTAQQSAGKYPRLKAFLSAIGLLSNA